MRTILFLALIVFSPLMSHPATAQYMYLDTNGNGVHDAGDILPGAGEFANLDVWLSTDRNRDGSSAICSTLDGPLSMVSYEFNLYVSSGTITWGPYTNRITSFGISTALVWNSTQFTCGFAGTSYLAAGVYRLGTLPIYVASGNPYIAIAPSTTLGDFCTCFGSQCSGSDFDATLKLGTDWVDADGAGSINAWLPDGIKVAPVAIPEIHFQNTPDIVSDGSGGAVVSWADFRNGGGVEQDIYAQRLNASGARFWDPVGVPLTRASGGQAGPHAAPDGAGGAFVVWVDSRVGTEYDLYMQHVTWSGALQSGWPADGFGVCTGFANQNDPRIASDASGSAYLAWRDQREYPRDLIYAQKVEDSGGGPQAVWSPGGVFIDTLLSGNVSIVPDRAGGAIVAWVRRGVRLQRIGSLGQTLWPSGGVLVSSPAGSQCSLAEDGAGGVYVAWMDSDDIYAQRAAADGSTYWPGGVLVYGDGLSQSHPVVVASTGIIGNAIVAWGDARSGGASIYAQMLGPLGAPVWAPSGVAVCTENATSYLRMIQDGSGGAVLSWRDFRNSPDGDVYAQRLYRSGSPVWQANGVPVCTAADVQEFTQMVGDGAGGAILAWEDHRDPYDHYVFAMRVAPQGGTYATAVEAEHAPPPRAALDQNRPNPFNPTTSIRFELPASAHVRLTVYSVDGRRVASLLDAHAAAGPHEVMWDGRDGRGRRASSGVYYYQLVTDGHRPLTRRMVMLK